MCLAGRDCQQPWSLTGWASLVSTDSMSHWSSAMSLSPKHTTPFSVTDILSPLDHETYKKTTIEAAIPPLTPYRNSQHPQAMAGMGGMGAMGGMSVPVTNPYHNYVPPLSHHTASFPTQYCNGSDLAYGDPSRHSAASWYGANPDPRFACKYILYISHNFLLLYLYFHVNYSNIENSSG